MKSMHWMAFGVGLLLGWLVLPGVIGWARGLAA